MLRDSLYPYEVVRSVEGKTILTKGTNVRIRSSASATSAIKRTVAASGTAVGKCQGRVWYDSNPQYKWYEIEGGGFIRNDLATLTGEAKPLPVAKPKNDDEEAQRELDTIVSQDRETMNNLNTAAAMIETLKNKGVATVTSANKIKTIFARLQERQEAMKKTTWGKVKDTVSNAWGSVKRFFGFNGMGELITIAIIAGIALVAGAGTTALVMLKPWKIKATLI